MRNTIFLRLSVVLLATMAAFAQQKGGGNPVGMIREIKPGLYMVPGAGANTEVRVMNGGLVVVDGKLAGEANYNALMEQIQSVSKAPIRMLIVTQHHADHSGNNDRFLAAGLEVVAQEDLNEELKTYAVNPKPAPANKTFKDAYEATINGALAALARHFAPGHTGGDSIVYFPDLKVVVLSDILTPPNGSPLIDYAGGGSALGWLKALQETLKLDFDTAIPGNGDPVSKAEVQAYEKKVEALVARARELVNMGTPADKLLEAINASNLGLTLRLPAPQRMIDELKIK
jgi:glyoxylase-like metal-dependent hydrolase (beta-lactamase superfamily II)